MKGSKGLEDVKQTELENKITEFFNPQEANPEDVKNQRLAKIINFFFSNPDNPLVWSAKKLNAALRTGALAFEATYLGWGLPAINQKRLEHKYLKEHPEENSLAPKDKSSNSLIDKSIKANEINLYGKFIK